MLLGDPDGSDHPWRHRGRVVVAGVELLEYLRIDDPIGAVPVHGICGIWGTLSLGFFASGQFGASGPAGPEIRWHSRVSSMVVLQLLKAQFIGSFIVTACTFSVALALMYIVHLTEHFVSRKRASSTV